MELVVVTASARLTNGFNTWLTTPVSVPLAVTAADTDGDVTVVTEASLVLCGHARLHTIPFVTPRHPQTLGAIPVGVAALPADALASDLALTGRRAAIAVVLVAVIASLVTFSAELNIFSNDPITAAGDLAAYAGVLIESVAVIADLEAFRIFGEVLPDDSITAGCDRAAAGAGVGIDQVAVITSLCVRLADLQITTSDAITADRKLARIAAGVGVFKIAVIASFACIETAVTAP